MKRKSNINIVEKYRLKKIINAAGTMTALGSSSVPPEVIEEMRQILPLFLDVFELQKRASEVIARVTNAEAGCVTACAASGLAIAIAAAMTERNLAKVEQIPDTKGLKSQIIIQKGHTIWSGASMRQMIRLAGAKVVEIGDAKRAGAYQLEGAIGDETAAGVYIVSHATTQYGLIPLEEYSRVARKYDIPVIVDAASETNMQSFLRRGADLAIFSGHKFLAGPTSGILAGQRELIEACLLHQFHGIGRAMKAGKESIIGVMAALNRWESLDPRENYLKQQGIIDTIVSGLTNVDGLTVTLEPDPTNNPILRVRVAFDSRKTVLSAFHVAQELEKQDPPVYVRKHHAIDNQYFTIDLCNITLDDSNTITDHICRMLARPTEEKTRIKLRYPGNPNEADLLEQKFSNNTLNGEGKQIGVMKNDL